MNLVKRWLDDCVRVETKARIEPAQWTHVLVTYDGSRVAKGIKVYLNGRFVPLTVNYDFINQTFASDEPLRIGAGGGPGGRFRGLIDDVRIYNRCLTETDAAVVAELASIDEILATEASERTESQQKKMRQYFLARAASETTRKAHRRLTELKLQRERLVESFPTVMVMKEMPQPRQTHVLTRGRYDKPAAPVAAGVPAIFPPLPDNAPANRLGLAEWLTDPTNPLTARVIVNDYWQMFFGTGIVKTAEDFGTQGERPTHPALIDWLATEFMRTGWDVKAIQRLILTSATYRQSSRATPALTAKDPENRLLARGPRFRMRAETVRDQALSAAGLLADHIGGRSVKPYQPSDLWKDIATDSEYVQDHGADLYRRGLYVYWKRTVVPPAMSAFDETAREMCRVRPRRTNTPLQALTLLNDVTFVEAARVLAQNVMAAAPTADERIRLIVQRVLARTPSDREMKVLRRGLADYESRFRSDPAFATRLISAGEYPLPENTDNPQLAAYTTIASLILNLDEAVTKQ